MGINLSNLSQKAATTEVTFMGQTATITYDPTLITLSESSAERDSASFIDFFCRLVKNWDVTKGGKKVPLTSASLQNVPLPLLRSIFAAILDADYETASEEGKG